MAEKIVVVVGARLNSSRLPRKQLLPLAGRPLIEHLFRRLEAVPDVDRIILATTADAYNKDLVSWAEKAGKSCFAYAGDVNNLMARVDAVAEAEDAGIVVYICGDSPLVEPVTLGRLIASLKADPEADWARLATLPEGAHYIHEGFIVYRRAFWQRMMDASLEPFEREHVGSVFHSLQKVLPDREAIIEDEPIFHALNHRVSVDTPSDYAFMSEVYERWYRIHDADTLVDLRWVVRELQRDAALRALNANVHQKTVKERSLRIQLLAAAGGRIGLGHLRRMVAAAGFLQDDLGAGVEILVLGDKIDAPWLQVLRHQTAARPQDLPALRDTGADILIVDVPDLPEELGAALADWKKAGVRLISVDKMPKGDLFDAAYFPSILSPGKPADFEGPVVGGWGSHLLPTRRPVERQADTVLVLTGGSDACGLGRSWPGYLDMLLPEEFSITWVQGPMAPAPDLSGVTSGRKFDVLVSPSSLSSLMARHGGALSVYGVSYYECLHMGLPTVAYAPQQTGLEAELAALKSKGAIVATGEPTQAVQALAELVSDKMLCASITDRDWGLVARNAEGLRPISALARQVVA